LRKKDPWLPLAVLLAGAMGLAGAAHGAAPAQIEVETALTCQCGCGLTVHSCNHLNCSSAIPLKEEIRAEIGAGRSLTEILTRFETKYGEKILSAPTTRGFNLAAWVVPFVAIGLGGLFVGVILRRWRGSHDAHHPAAPEAAAAPSAAERKLRERLERELRERE